MTAPVYSLDFLISKYEELKIPVPDDSICKHCRQVLTQEHKTQCKNQISKDMEECQSTIKDCKKQIVDINANITKQRFYKSH